jgi:chemosensory pili system protein ChpA (sensor histidine kinase/response regulator)
VTAILANDTAPEFDLGPLTWVQGEIDQALGRGLEALAAFKATPNDPTTLKHARTHIHQAAGAIQMVGLDAVTAYTDELERQLLRLEDAAPSDVEAACDLIDRACRKLRIFLDELVGGANPVPLKLFPEYELMQQARGIKAAAPTDLFYPDLSPRAPKITTAKTVTAQKLPSFLLKQRRLYQRGLLAWLNGDEEASRVMRDAIQGIEDVQTHSAQRSYWWTVGALLESIVERGVESAFGVKQLCGRVDLQIRRFVEGSAKVADRMRREVLYYVAISAPVGPQVQAVQRAFRLQGLIPSADVLSADVVRVQPLLREMRDLLAAAKDLWLKLTSGRAETLPKLKQVLSQLRDKTTAIGEPSLSRLAAALAGHLDKLTSGTVSDALAMEYATGLLLADSALDNFASISPEFPKQVDAMLLRIDAAAQNLPVPDTAVAPILDEMARRAQERLVLAQVAREIQTNLRHMEQVLDAFFRDHAKRADLATLTHDSAQITGALKMLGLGRAEQLLALCQQQIDQYAQPDTAVVDEDLESLAESLSGLGFYIEAVEQQRPNRERLIEPMLARRLGVEALEPAPDVDTVETAVADMEAALPATLAAFQRAPGDAGARERLQADLTTLIDDAKLIDDAQLQEEASAALEELTRAREGDTAALQEAIGAIASNRAAAPAPAPSEETMRLLETDASLLDAELLEIFLTEADEVLDTIAANGAQLRANRDDREALVTVRRGFHTLKGSGRMVGLSDLGDLAFDVEKLQNRLLEEDLPVTLAMVELIEVAQTSFRGWVDALRRDGRVAADASAWRAAVAKVVAEMPSSNEPPPPPPPTPPTGGPPPPPDISAHAVTGAAPMIEVLELDETMSPDADRAANDDAAAALDFPPVIEFAPRAATPHFEAARATTEDVAAALPPTAPVESEETTVGDVTLSTALYRILCDEAQQHLATLDAELQALQFDPAATPSQTMVRASHTLCGIHRTGGFPLLASTAKALEQCLLGLQARGAPLPGAALPVLARAIAGLTALAARVRRREAFDPGDEAEAIEIVGELETLRQEATTEPVLEDSESIAERVAEDEELAQAAAQPAPPVAVPKLVETFPPPLDDSESIAEPVAEDEELAQAAAQPAPPVAVPKLVETFPPPLEDSESIAEPVAEDEELAQAAARPAPPLAVPKLVETLSPPQVTISAEPVAMVHAPALPRVAPVMAPLAIPAAATQSDEAELLLAVTDDVDRQVLPIFLEEAAELFPQASEQLRLWRRKPGDVQPVQGLKRTLHTFKGSARMAGAMRLGELTHLMESRLPENAAVGRATPALLDALDNDLDHIAFVLDRLHKGEVNSPLPWLAVDQVPDAIEADSPAPAAADMKAQVVATLPVVPFAANAAAAVPAASETEGARAQLRVRADLIDRLVNEAGEVAIARARVEGELRSLKSNLLELTGSVIRLRTQVREIEIQADSQIQSRMSMANEAAEGFDPLEFDRFTRFQELTRGIAEGVNDVSTVQQSLLKNLDEADAALLAQARLSRDVQQQLFSIRTVPFGSLSERLYRILRQTAKELDKRANLEILGTQVELDRSVLEKLVGPLDHLLRNALDHGLEAREARRKSGKPEIGEITLNVRQQGNEIAIELSDDGAGLDLSGIADKARKLGLVPADADPTEARLIECIFAPGFSTATNVTHISGRGVGMDVVRSEIAALGGRVEVATVAGKGTTFTMFLPLTLAIAQTVLVRAGGRLWALPAPMVEQVQQIRDKDLINLYLSREVAWQGRKYPFFYLPRLLGNGGNNPETTRYNSIVLLKSGQNVTAVHVDEMIGNQEVVVKNIGPQLARVSGIAGATVLGNGEVVLIINPVQLAQRMDVGAEAPTVVKTPQAAKAAAVAAAAAGPPLVMIVDDSLTVRKITGRLLVREGFDIVTAKDGFDALQLVAERTPDAILLDIEMPRMDGFEFAKTIKADTQLANIPIIMITSRTAEKHRNRAKELGVDVYLGKPYQEEELLRHLRELVAVAA